MCAKKTVSFPKYVIFGGTTPKTGTTMRFMYVNPDGSDTYYRDAGNWGNKS